MGLRDKVRATLGSMRTMSDMNRRLIRLETELTEVNQRTLTLSHQVEHLRSVLDQADPQASLDIATGVRDSVRELAIELTEQANRTSELLSELEGHRI